MSDDNNGSFELSRRKALAGLGSIGVAGALGVGGTWAQFTDSEQATVDFTAGGIDGTLAYTSTYNTQEGASSPNIVASSDDDEDGDFDAQNGTGVTMSFDDVKPGDYGAITFELEVQNNAAWVASCVGVESDTDGDRFEPEQEREAELGGNDGPNADVYSNLGSGELAENFLMIPFYANELPATFFDNGWPNDDFGPQMDDENGDGEPEFSSVNLDASALSEEAVGTNEGFWNSREGENDWGQLRPMDARKISQSELALGTQYWHNGEANAVEAPTGTDAGPGCVFLDGAALDGPTDTDARQAAPLEPGDTVIFGYDWHIPFGVGNEVQGDEMTLNLGFTFAQTRHTTAPQFSNIYSPGSQPAGGE